MSDSDPPCHGRLDWKKRNLDRPVSGNWHTAPHPVRTSRKTAPSEEGRGQLYSSASQTCVRVDPPNQPTGDGEFDAVDLGYSNLHGEINDG
jgi:hypothetical protein